MRVTKKQHFWTAVCDANGNQIDGLIYCDRCGKTLDSSTKIDPVTGNIRKEVV